MKENNSRKKQLIFFRFWAGQLPLIVLFVLYMMREVISLQILWCVTIGMCMSTSFVVNHYFMKEVKKAGRTYSVGAYFVLATVRFHSLIFNHRTSKFV